LAGEREANEQEITAVKAGQSSAYSWENGGKSWKLLYLDTKAKAWKYAKDRWVQIGSHFYFFDTEGNAMEGWFQLDGKWYFAEYDNKKRSNENAGIVLMGWASIPNEKGVYHSFYFTKDENGRPSGDPAYETEIVLAENAMMHYLDENLENITAKDAVSFLPNLYLQEIVQDKDGVITRFGFVLGERRG